MRPESKRIEKCRAKRRKSWYSAFSPFPAIFPKGFFPRLFDTRDCLLTLYSIDTHFEASTADSF